MSRKPSKGTSKHKSRKQAQPAKGRGPIVIAAIVLVLGCVAIVAWMLRGVDDQVPSATVVDLTWDVPNPTTTHMQPQVARALREHRERTLRQINSSQAWGELGRFFDAHDLQAEADHCYRHAVALAPQNPQWAYLYAFIRDIRFADTDEVATLYERMLSIADYPPAAFRLGDALSRRGRLEAARDAFRRAIAFDPNFGMAHRSLGQTLLSMDDLAGARIHLERAEQLMPDDGITQIALSQLYMRLGETARAERAAQQASVFRPNTSVPDPFRFQLRELAMGSRQISERVSQLMSQNKCDEAIVQLSHLREALPNDASVHYRMGVCFEQLGRRNEAIAAYRRAVQIAPEHQAAERLAQLTAG